MIKAIIFDFDGVLVESVDIKTNAFAILFEDEGEDIVKQVVDHHIKNTGVSRFDKFRYFYRALLKRDLTDERFAQLCDRFSKLVVEEVVNAPYVKGGKEFLDSYCGIYKCFIVSATPQPEIEDIIARRGMGRYFAEIFGAPHKKVDAVREITARYGYHAAEVAYVGDALSDYEAAAINRIRFIARVNGDGSVFKDIDCVKVPDMVKLKKALDQF